MCDSDGHRPLHLACRNETCSLEVVRYLVGQDTQALMQKNSDGNLPLHGACGNEFCSREVVGFLLEKYTNALKQKNNRGMLPLHSCFQCFKHRRMDYASLLERMRLLLPRYREAIDVAPSHGDWSLWPTREEYCLYKEVAGLFLEEIELRDQLEWATQVVEVLSLTSSTIGVKTACWWATEWRKACGKRLDAIEGRVAALEDLMEVYRVNA